MHDFLEILDHIDSSFPKKTTCSEFFEKGFKLTSRDRLEFFDISYTPWTRVYIKWFQDDITEWIGLCQASQTCKTITMMGFFLYIMCFMDASVLWSSATEPALKSFVNSRLKPFVEAQNLKMYSKLSLEQFTISDSIARFGASTIEISQKEYPAKYIFCDELADWIKTTENTKKRTRTYKGERKGFFGGVPPQSKEHHAWRTFTGGNFYSYWIPCWFCGFYQPFSFKNLVFKDAKKGVDWDLEEILKIAHLPCVNCKKDFPENRKNEIMNEGREVCVDPDRIGTEIEEVFSTTKTLQISSMYSVFTTWGEIAVDFIESKQKGLENLKIFFTDELSQSYSDKMEKFRLGFLKTLRDKNRKKGEKHKECSHYTAGVDIQGVGIAYWSVWGWKKEEFWPSGHLIDYGIINFKAKPGQKDDLKKEIEYDWGELDLKLSKYTLLDVALDSSDGEMTHAVYAACAKNGWTPLKDEVKIKQIVFFSKVVKQKKDSKEIDGNNLLIANSIKIKNEMALGLKIAKDVKGAWSFPGDCSNEFLTHITNEQKVKERNKKGKVVIKWRAVKRRAPQHFFSSSVYACAVMIPHLGKIRKKKFKKRIKRDLQGQNWIGAGKNWL